MYFTYVVRPGEAPDGRGPAQEPCWEAILSYMLRFGYVCQLLSHVGLGFLVGVGAEKPFQLLNFFRVRTDNVGTTPIWAVIVLLFIGICGYAAHVGFLVLSDDDGSIKQSRGFRAGTKFLAQGTSFGLVSAVFTMISFYTANWYFSDKWTEQQLGTGAPWLVYYIGRFADALAMFCYAGAVFCLETYHSEGAGELWGWLIGLAYKTAGVAEIVMMVTSKPGVFEMSDQVYSVAVFAALLCGTVWALRFEPISQRYDVRMTQSAMRTESYKSRNAVAYYGPGVVHADVAVEVPKA